MPRLRLKGHLLHLPFARATGRKGPRDLCGEGRVEQDGGPMGSQVVCGWPACTIRAGPRRREACFNDEVDFRVAWAECVGADYR
jgi:hypothetical protein